MEQKRKKKKFKMALSTKLSLGLISLGLIGLVAGGYLFSQKAKGIQFEAAIQRGYQIEIHEEDFKKRFNTQVFDDKGQLIQEFSTNKFEYISYDAMPKTLPLAVVAIEDKRYYEHKGVDVNAFKGIVQSQITGGQVRGGSTVTQQLAKNVYLSNEQTIERKLTEMVIGQRLNKQFSKEQILEFYLNNVYFGHGAYGINTASLTYFNKPVTEATLYEQALMVGITNNPTLFDPVSNQENAHKRALIILSEMRKQGFISKEEEKAAVSAPSQAGLHIQNDNKITSYPVKFAVDNTVEKLMELDGFVFRYKFDDYDKEAAYKEEYLATYNEFYQRVINGGYIIKTSIDQEKQAKVQEFVTNHAGIVPGKEATATVIDNRTNMVVAIVGGVAPESEFNRASQGYRQAGSSLKPFISYGPALERGYGPQSIISDAKGNQYYPENWYTEFWGDIPNLTITKALALSSNRPAYRLAAEMEDPRQPLADMKFRGLAVDDKNPIIAVGGFTNGVRNVDVAGAINMLTTGGVHQNPSNVYSITDRSNGNVIFDRKDEAKRQIFSAQTSHTVLKMMQAVTFDSQGTGRKLSFGYPYLATKTGTTDYHKDLWSTGATPYYSLAVQTGHDDGHDQEYEQEIPPAIFRDVMSYLHQGLPHIDFELREGSASINMHPKILSEQNTALNKAIEDAKSNPLNEGRFDKQLYNDLKKMIARAKGESYYKVATVDALYTFMAQQSEGLIAEEYKSEIQVLLNDFLSTKRQEALNREGDVSVQKELVQREEERIRLLIQTYYSSSSSSSTSTTSSSDTQPSSSTEPSTTPGASAVIGGSNNEND